MKNLRAELSTQISQGKYMNCAILSQMAPYKSHHSSNERANIYTLLQQYLQSVLSTHPAFAKTNFLDLQRDFKTLKISFWKYSAPNSIKNKWKTSWPLCSISMSVWGDHSHSVGSRTRERNVESISCNRTPFIASISVRNLTRLMDRVIRNNRIFW